MRLLQDFRDSPRSSLRSWCEDRGRLVQLTNVTDFQRREGPGQIDRYNRERQITVVANLFQKPLGEAMSQGVAAVQRPGYSQATPRATSVGASSWERRPRTS
jgi:multidrug efflux pump subunit AcrB